MADTAKKTKAASPRKASAQKANDVEQAKPIKAAARKGIELVPKVESLKKAPSPKPRKTATKKETVVAIAQPRVVSREMIAQVAYLKWVQRGYQHGCALEDWIKAEQELLGRAS